MTMTLSEGYRQMHGYYTGYEKPKDSLFRQFYNYISGKLKIIK